ncbi:hypothetical protein HELRODRAFT_136179, partial [Helobdella robusta]|uniref:Fibrinogen C-terminal domain-containing protein n=1 Tax=Helobdella robusta TaxID=6412 RepID=T1EIC4_HELRO
GWIVIQQRIDNTLSFNQNWNTYKSGFGNYCLNFWLGLEKMHQLTSLADYRLRFEVLTKGVWVSDEYDHFVVRSEFEKYSLNVSGYCGYNNDVLNNSKNPKVCHNGMKFSTPDQDNDQSSDDCAYRFTSGFWFNSCYHFNVNGMSGS